jgi:hypothetical protein
MGLFFGGHYEYAYMVDDSLQKATDNVAGMIDGVVSNR